jgi:transcriptional regulator with XRE-family HTH domain
MPYDSLPPTRLKLLRVARGWSQEELARRAGVSSVMAGACERGMTSPSMLERIAAALGEPDPARLLDRVTDLGELRSPEPGDAQ